MSGGAVIIWCWRAGAAWRRCWWSMRSQCSRASSSSCWTRPSRAAARSASFVHATHSYGLTRAPDVHPRPTLTRSFVRSLITIDTNILIALCDTTAATRRAAAAAAAGRRAEAPSAAGGQRMRPPCVDGGRLRALEAVRGAAAALLGAEPPHSNTTHRIHSSSSSRIHGRERALSCRQWAHSSWRRRGGPLPTLPAELTPEPRRRRR